MRPPRASFRFLILLPALVPLVALSSPRSVRLTDFRALVRIVSPRFSPDGKQIAFVTSRSDFVHDRYDHTLRVIAITGGRSRVLARGMRGLRMPRWSPDGRTIAFIAKVGAGKEQIYTVPVSGGTPIEVGDAPNGVQQMAWSPDGGAIAYVTPDDSSPSAQVGHTDHDFFAVHDDDYLTRAPPVPAHLWLLSLRNGNARELTGGASSVLETTPPIGGSVSGPSWSADGRWIAYTQQADADDSDSDRTQIVSVRVASGVEHPITSHRTYEYDPRFAPLEDEIAYLYPHGPGPVSDMDLFVSSPESRAVRDLSANLDRNILPDFAWLSGGEGLVGMADYHVRVTLYQIPLKGNARPLNLGGRDALAVSASRDGALAVVVDSATAPPELYLLRTPASGLVRLTHFNRAFERYAFPRSVEVRWQAPDGTRNDGILTYPNDYRSGRRYPLVVYSHGGPEGASIENFDGGEIGPLRDLFASQGMLVFEPNYRGSDNLGNAHEHAIYRDPGNGPDSDVISGIRMLERIGIVDPSRIAAVGHSYGGYLTAWLIAHQHFWRCAVVADGVVDWTEEYELSGAGNLAWTRDSLGGGPWESKSAALYRTGSPMTYAAAITTPTLILSGTDDAVVPITESFALYHALASRHVPVRFIAIAGAHHSPHDPVDRELYYRTIDEWVQAHLGAK